MKRKLLCLTRCVLICGLAAAIFLTPASAKYVSTTILNYNQWTVAHPVQPIDEGLDFVFTVPILITPATGEVVADAGNNGNMNNGGLTWERLRGTQLTLTGVPAGWYAFEMQGASGGTGRWQWTAITSSGMGGEGGRGARLSGIFYFAGGTLVLRAGRGGASVMNAGFSGNPQWGGGHNGRSNSRAGGGGGYSGIFHTSVTQGNAIAIAGGGGGGGGGNTGGDNGIGRHGGNGEGGNGTSANGGTDTVDAQHGRGGGGGGGGGAVGSFGSGLLAWDRPGGIGGDGGLQDGNPGANNLHANQPAGSWVGPGGGGGGTPNVALDRGGSGGPFTPTPPRTGTAHAGNPGSALQGGNASTYDGSTLTGSSNGSPGGGGWHGGEGGYYGTNNAPGPGGGGGASFLAANIYPLGTAFASLRPAVPSLQAGTNTTRDDDAIISSSRTNTDVTSFRPARHVQNGYVWILYLGAQYPGAESDWTF